MSDYAEGQGWWQATDGRYYPPEQHPNALVPATELVPYEYAEQAVDEVLGTVGDVRVTRHWIVTPSRTIPLAGTNWIARDRSHTQRVIPGWAIACSIIFFLACFLGLLFLAIKEDVISGHVEVEITGPDGFRHITQVDVFSPRQVQQAVQFVGYVQQMAVAA